MVAPRFKDYSERYSVAHLRREDGILEITLHTDGGEVVWNPVVHQELTYLLGDVAGDPENKVVIVTGTGDSFIHQHRLPKPGEKLYESMPTQTQIQYNVPKLLLNHLDVQVPMIA